MLEERQTSRWSREICLSELMSPCLPPEEDIDIMTIDILCPPSRYPTEPNKTWRNLKILYNMMREGIRVCFDLCLLLDAKKIE